MKVKAKSLGYYGNKRRYEGQVFHIKELKEFSYKWMEALDFDPDATEEVEGKTKKKVSKKTSKKSAEKSKPLKVEEKYSEKPVKSEVDLNEEVI